MQEVPTAVGAREELSSSGQTMHNFVTVVGPEECRQRHKSFGGRC